MENNLHLDISLMYGRDGINGKEDNACSAVSGTEVSGCNRGGSFCLSSMIVKIGFRRLYEKSEGLH